MKPEIIFIICGIIIIGCLIYLNKPKEGFATQGSVPTSTQTSSIPADIPGATSTNPTASKPESKDIEDISERLKNFLLLVDQKLPIDTNLVSADRAAVDKLAADAPLLQSKLQKANINFDTSGFTIDEFASLRVRIINNTELLRGAAIVAPPATPTDVQSAIDSLGRFSTLVTQKRPENTNISEPEKSIIMKLRDDVPDLEQRLLAALAQSDASIYTTGKLGLLKARIEKAINALSKASVVGSGAGTMIQTNVPVPTPVKDEAYAAMIKAEPQPTVVAGPVGVITIEQLKDLVKRIGDEHLRLSNLRSTSASITTRIQQLGKLKADLGDIITKVEMKQMKLEDVPITSDAASKFLAGFKGDSGPLPPLIVPAGALPASVAAPKSVSKYAGIPAGEQAVQQLLTAAKDLRWSMEVRLEYDPQLKTREAMLGRIENIIKNLTMLSVSETPLPPKIHDQYIKELSTIQQKFSNDPARYTGGDVGAMSRLPTVSARDPARLPAPSAEAVSAAQGAGFGPVANTFPHGEISPDVYIRPGFVMNDAQIAHRASAASFIPAAGGPDYKARSLELCRQVKSAQLGDTASFGCIANPDEVGPSYDWKGNYTMVCNRLGDSWGRAYPEQFGCPPYDPTAKFASGF